ncbi:MAG: hypothetical protein ACLFUU_00410 [Desulfobacteraceae bacterium]
MKKLLIVWLLITALVIMSCATYRPQVTPFKLPQAYANVQRVNGAFVAARSWTQEEEARAVFGFNIIKAGLLPVQVVFDNQGSQTLQINPGQTFLVNNNNEMFPVLDDQSAYDRVTLATDFPEAVRGFAKGGFLGGAAGALIGAAVGVVAGREAGEYAMRGAVAGAATGGILGAGAGGSSELGRTITEDLYNRTLSNNPIKPQEVAHGIILFPAEAGRPEILRLQLKEKDTDKTYNLNLIL